MSKFKVGDRVKPSLVYLSKGFSDTTDWSNAVVRRVGGSIFGDVDVEAQDGTSGLFFDEELELVEEESTMGKFPIGSRVRMTKQGFDNWGEDSRSNPRGVDGTVVGFDDESWNRGFINQVLWDTGGHNSYKAGDLELVTETAKETKQMQVPFTITGSMISVFIDGKSHFVGSTDGAFADLKEHLKGEHDVEVIRNLVDKKAFVTKVTEGLVTVTDQEVLYKGEPVHSALTQKLLTLVAEGFDVRPWARFMDNLMQNPSYKSREALFKFLDKWMAPITEDGCFLAFKNVRHNFKDIHSGTFDNSPGTIVSMPRDQVDDDSNRTCSAGLHAAATSYLKHFYANGSKTVVVKINPRDVVAVPYDYDSAKMRVCQYEVLREVEQEEITRLEQQALTTGAGTEWMDMYDEEFRDTEGDEYYSPYDDYYDSYDDQA